MEKEKGTDVLIDGKIYHLAGGDPEYLQRVSAYLNQKIAEIRVSPAYRGMDADYRTLFLELNLADDCFQARKEAQDLKARCEELEQELYAARHDAVSSRVKLENTLRGQR